MKDQRTVYVHKFDIERIAMFRVNVCSIDKIMQPLCFFLLLFLHYHA